MTPWYDIYRERMNSKYVDHVANKYAPFIKKLYENRVQNFTEIGCGAGNITRILREMNDSNYIDYRLVDVCPRMLSLAIENNPFPNCTFACIDVLDSPILESRLVHSHGLLEHFEDDKIREIVERVFRKTKTQIHYVPGAKYETPSRGDERLMSPEQWKKILKGLGKISVSTFNDEYDIILKIER